MHNITIYQYIFSLSPCEYGSLDNNLNGLNGNTHTHTQARYKWRRVYLKFVILYVPLSTGNIFLADVPPLSAMSLYSPFVVAATFIESVAVVVTVAQLFQLSYWHSCSCCSRHLLLVIETLSFPSVNLVSICEFKICHSLQHLCACRLPAEILETATE